MTITFTELSNTPRLLLEAELTPLQGTRFQPTGFPDLGAALYEGPDGEQMLLVESAQSMANRMEAVCWDETNDDWVNFLKGLPLVKVIDKNNQAITNSVLEAHRLNSEYIARTADFKKISSELNFKKDQSFNIRKQLVPFLMKYDFNALLHGIFLEEIGGVIRLPRSLSAFIEARNIKIASSGGVKFNRVEPGLKGGDGNAIFQRDEFVSPEITAFFNLDLAQIRAFGLGVDAEKLLIALALFKIQKFLQSGLRLRTACDLACKNLKVSMPEGYLIPSLETLETGLPGLVESCAGLFANPRITTITYGK